MKKYFTTGLAILLPILITIFIIGYFVNILTNPILNYVEAIVRRFDFFNEPFLIFQSEKVVTFFSKIFVLTGIIFTIFLAGMLGKLFLVDYLFRIGNKLFHKLPYFNKIYMSVGLVTKEFILVNHPENPLETIPVFVPGTPNPSVGFMLMFRRDELVLVNMKVDEALKFIVSCGVVMPSFSIQSKPLNTEVSA